MNPSDHNPYAIMLDTAQARITQLEAEKAALRATLTALCDAVLKARVHVPGFTPKLFVSEENSDLILAAVAEAREVLLR